MNFPTIPNAEFEPDWHLYLKHEREWLIRVIDELKALLTEYETIAFPDIIIEEEEPDTGPYEVPIGVVCMLQMPGGYYPNPGDRWIMDGETQLRWPRMRRKTAPGGGIGWSNIGQSNYVGYGTWQRVGDVGFNTGTLYVDTTWPVNMKRIS